MNKVVMIGLDVADIGLVQQGAREGWLPAIRRLLESGRSVRLLDDFSGLVSAQWYTLNTGASVQEHRAISAVQLRPGTYEVETTHASLPPFWRYVSDAGRRSAIFCVYGTLLLRDFSGSQVIGWGCVNSSALDQGYDPPEVEGWLKRELPGRRSGLLWSVPYEADELVEYLADALKGIVEHANGISLFMERTRWDLFACGFPESHDAAHFLWRYHDPTHDEHDPDGPAELKRGVRTIMERIDSAVADLLARIPPDTTVLLVSAHGMEPIPRGVCASETFLERGGWLQRVPTWSPGRGSGRGLLRLVRSALKRLFPLAVRRTAARLAPRARNRLVQATALSDIDWSATRAFALQSLQSTHVRVNLMGREPAGIVPPGDAYDRLLSEISEAAFELVDAETGEPAVADVVRTDGITGGPVGDVLPDLIVVWKRKSPKRLTSPRLGEIEVPWTDRRSGEHSAEGFVIGAGPGISASGSVELSDEVRPHVDVAPTVLRLLGVDVPDGLAGRAIEQLVGS